MNDIDIHIIMKILSRDNVKSFLNKHIYIYIYVIWKIKKIMKKSLVSC